MTKKKEIEFRASDDIHKRVENIWRCLGFGKDRMRHIPQVASYLYVYRDLDEMARELKEKEDE